MNNPLLRSKSYSFYKIKVFVKSVFSFLRRTDGKGPQYEEKEGSDATGS